MRGFLPYVFIIWASSSAVLAGQHSYVPSSAYPTIQSAIDAAEAGDVDHGDLETWQSCHAGLFIGPLSVVCLTTDLDGDGDVDQSDLGLFQRCYSGQGMLAAPNCMN